MISVLMKVRQLYLPVKTAVLFRFPSLIAVFTYLGCNLFFSFDNTCGKTHKHPVGRRSKGRYQNASLTVEASVAFPVFFFAVLYLLQMFTVLRAEVSVAQAGITSAREAAAFSYVAERLAEGENAVAETVLEVFDQKIIRDATLTGVFYTRCDEELLKQAKVAQGLGGIWVNSEETDEKVRTEFFYRVNPANVLTEQKSKYYVMRIVYRNWTGEGGEKKKGETSKEEKETVYMTEHGKVYHVKRDCSYIKIDVMGVWAEQVDRERNESGAKYYACEFCSPVLTKGTQVFITEYGTRYHARSTCSAIRRNVKEYSLTEVKEKYPACSKCRTEGGT